ncbi:MAG: ribonuclease PH, partial [Candidatus Omnitrophota bacterium]
TRCASITGSFISMVLALGKICKDGVIEKVPVADYVAAISVGILGGKPILDLDYDEDSTSEVDMNVIMTGADKFIEIQGTAEREPFTKHQMDELLVLAKKGIGELITAQKKMLKGIIGK